MNRYHYKVYFPPEADSMLETFTDEINSMQFRLTKHSFNNIDLRGGWTAQQELIEDMKSLELDSESIFEYYTSGGQIVKACYRVEWSSSKDIIMVIGRGKTIVTMYFNSTDDKHATLNKNNYVRRPRGC